MLAPLAGEVREGAVVFRIIVIFELPVFAAISVAETEIILVPLPSVINGLKESSVTIISMRVTKGRVYMKIGFLCPS